MDDMSTFAKLVVAEEEGKSLPPAFQVNEVDVNSQAPSSPKPQPPNKPRPPPPLKVNSNPVAELLENRKFCFSTISSYKISAQSTS
jgi:hypothetical protein